MSNDYLKLGLIDKMVVFYEAFFSSGQNGC